MISRIKQVDSIDTFDTEYWHLRDQLPDMPEDDDTPDVYTIDPVITAQQQRDMPEWLEQHDEASQYVIINNLPTLPSAHNAMPLITHD